MRRQAIMAGPNRGGGTRSGLYSEDKFTNWARFDPFGAEAERASKGRRPERRVDIGSESVPIFVSKLQPGFVRPFSAADVAKTLSQVPIKYIEELAGVYLLGGTAKQKRNRNFFYGMYRRDRIYLYALDERNLVQGWEPRPKPNIVREYARFGAKFVQESGRWTLRFTTESLRLFYLLDVLLHEVGHHVERSVRPYPSEASERYATWFANYQSLKLLRGDGEQDDNEG